MRSQSVAQIFFTNDPEWYRFGDVLRYLMTATVPMMGWVPFRCSFLSICEHPTVHQLSAKNGGHKQKKVADRQKISL
jgi:hypothetical protein